MCLFPDEGSRLKPSKFEAFRFRRADEMNLSERGLGAAVESNPICSFENYTEEALQIIYPSTEEKPPF
jgi:hypothetical protein